MASSGTSIAVAEAVWEQIKSSRSGLSSASLSSTDPAFFASHPLFSSMTTSVRRSPFHNLERATRIVDQGGVRKLSATPSRRSLFLVVGESRKKEEYICFPEHHCTCYSFFYDVVNRGEQLCCKHQIAARLAEAVGQLEEMEVSDEQLAVMLSKL
ncbi:hypothetical protein ZIOFF_066238 [Zingiber officinale]|uniref:SWIM-type domain-containing protein n=1 Tax=Zingiber officinale TaxID=94328 RepID=A0A8J5KDP3_ZINOF|nr:hypothetical protein ZIOFF_066238 [Zingiber officinale]